MRLLLINNNPAVSRLINLSAKKYGYEIEEFKSDDFDLNENYDVTITDNEAVSENSILFLKESGNLGDIIFIGPKGFKKPIYANYFLQKPFLPTDFIDMTKKIEKSKNQNEIKKEEIENINEENLEPFVEHDEDDMSDSEMMALDLDELDNLDLPMPDDELYDEKSEEINNNKGNENLQEDSAKIDDVINESDVEQVVDELSGEELSASKESDNEDFKLDTEDDIITKENSSILDSEDIAEVKQLLIDDIEDKEVESDEGEIELDNDLAYENDNLEAVEIEKNKGLGELVQDVEDMKKPEEILQEIESIHKENIEIPEETVDDIEVAEISSCENIDVISEDKSSIDDLTQKDLNDLFGEENVEEDKKVKNLYAEELKEELQAKIEEDVKKILNKDEIKDALKDLVLNISISIDEQQK